MSPMPTPNLPAPAQNLTAAGLQDRATDFATSATIRVAVGDFTGGAAEQLFTLTSHGMASGTVVHCVWQSAMGTVVGGEGSRWYVKSLSSSTFQLYSDSALATVSTNTVDGTAVFISGDIDSGLVQFGIVPNVIVDAWDFTGGTVEDVGVPAQGTHGLYEGDQIKLVYKSAAGVTAGTLDTVYFAKAPTVTYHQIAATSGGSVIDSTADGTAVFLKIS
jgi:hypothetical protein